MLPLIVGGIAGPAEEPEDAEVVEPEETSPMETGDESLPTANSDAPPADYVVGEEDAKGDAPARKKDAT